MLVFVGPAVVNDRATIMLGGSVQGKQTIPTGVWVHIAFTHNRASNECTIYINGVLDGQSRNPSRMSWGSQQRSWPMYLGHDRGRYNKSYQLAEVQVWGRLLSPSEIRTRMLVRAAKEDNGLLACWPLTGAEGNRIADCTGRFPATASAAKWVEVDELPLFAKQAPEGLSCRYFDGKTAHINVHTSSTFRAPSFTVQAWVRPEKDGATALEAPIVNFRIPGYGWELGCSGTEASFTIADASGAFERLSFNHSALNTWTHVAASWTGKVATLFVNGLEVASKAINGTRSRANELEIGRQAHWGGRHFQGRLCEVRFYTKVRSSAEILHDMFERGFTKDGTVRVDATGLIHVWPLDDIEPAVAKDFAGDSPGYYKGATPLDTAGWQLIGMEPVSIEVKELSSRVQALEEERNQLRGQLAARNTENQNLQIQINQLKKLSPQVGQLTQIVAGLQEQIQAREKLIAELQAKQAQQSLSVSLDDFIDLTNNQIRQARARLAQDKRNLRLGRVSIDLKVVPDEDGRAFRFPKLADSAGLVDLEPGKLSNLTVEFEDNEPPPAPPTTRQVPNIGGYTEAMARRVLTEAGFSMTAHAQAVGPDSSEDYGRVLTQHPPAGEQAPVNANILVFIGKEA